MVQNDGRALFRRGFDLRGEVLQVQNVSGGRVLHRVLAVTRLGGGIRRHLPLFHDSAVGA